MLVLSRPGDLFHGINAMECAPGTTGTRVSIVLEQYHISATPRSITVGVDGERLVLDFGDNATRSERRSLAEEFVAEHRLADAGGTGCEEQNGTEEEGFTCVARMIAERMDVIVDAQREAQGEVLLCSGDVRTSSGSYQHWFNGNTDMYHKLGQDSASDFAQLRVSQAEGQELSLDGVFATRRIPKGSIVCEVRGHHLREGDDQGAYLGRSDPKKEENGLQFVAAGVCSLVRGCQTSTCCLGDGCVNSKIVWDVKSKKVFIQATRGINPGEEILYDLQGSMPGNIWRTTDYAHSPKSSLRTGNSINSNSNGYGADASSDFANLYVTASRVDAIEGVGVFAARDIDEGVILCEMRGRILQDGDASSIQDEKRMVHETRSGMLVAAGVCSLVNDCRDAATVAVVFDMVARRDTGICWPGFAWNSHVVTDVGGKVFLRSTRPIVKDEEIFLDYGDEFWYWHGR